MSSSFNLQFSVAPFPTGFEGDLNAYATQLAANLSATITGNFLTGQIGGSAPTSNIGPWANGTQWWFWNASLSTPAYESEFSLIQPEYNTLINGDCQILQRNAGGTVVGATPAYFGPDRWKYTGSMTNGRVTISQALSGLSAGSLPATFNYGIEYCYQAVVTTTQASLSAGDHFTITQGIEQQYARQLFGLTSSLSIALWSSVVGTVCVSIGDAGQSQTYVMDCQITTPNTWTYFPFPNIPTFPGGGTYGGSDTAVAYYVNVCLAAGSTWNTGIANTWNAANVNADSTQTNFFASTATVKFTMVKHQPGSICTPFQPKTFDQVLSDCQRYYSKSYDYGTYAGASAVNPNQIIFSTFSNSCAGYVRYPKMIRIAPTFGSNLNIYSPVTGASSAVRDNAGAADVTVSAVNNSGKNGFGFFTTTGITTGNVAFFHYAADTDF